jgi:tetratricopeptide (TPR) repeat protein
VSLALGAAFQVAALSLAYAAPSETAALTDQAAAALMRGEAQQAVTSYTAALGDAALSNDRRASILNDRGLAYVRLGQAKLAIEDFNRAAQLFPEYAAVYNNRGSLLLSLGVLKEAIKDFDRALLLAPGYVAAYNNRAAALVRSGQLDEAIGDYTKAIELVPTSPAPLSGRGRAHLSLMRPHAAIRDFTRAVGVDARFAAGYRNRAEAKLEVEHYEEAIEDLSRAIAFDVSNAEIYVLRGQAYLATKNTASAIKDFSQAIELNGKLAGAYAARGLAHGMAQAFEEAYADLNKAIELDPRSSVAFAYRAFVYKQNGHLDVGLRDIETAVKVDAERPEVYWAKAEIEEAQGQIELAVADLRKALVLRPGYRDVAESLQRLGAMPAAGEEKIVAGAGVDTWRVVVRGNRYFAVDDQYPRLSVPLEMMGEGEPRLIEWELKKAPFKGIGVLKFYGGATAGRQGPEDVELAAVLDVEESKVIAIEPHRQGTKVASWTWEEGKVTVASVDGVTDELPVRVGKESVAAGAGRRDPGSEPGYSGWAPWAQPWGGGWGAPPPKPRTARKKSKSIFDLLFN